MKVDIIIPFYNTDGNYLKECLNSIYNQSIQDYRIILINDNSSANYNFKHDKIVYLSNTEHLGISKSVNKAFNIVNSEYCVRIDSDDVVTSDFLKKEIEFLDKNQDYVAVCCDTFRLKNNIKSGKYLNRPTNWNFVDVLNKKYHGYGYAGGLMFRSHYLNILKLDESYPVCEDFDFHMNLLRQGKIHSIKDERLYYYRLHSNQTIHKYSKEIKLFFINKTLEKIKKWNVL